MDTPTSPVVETLTEHGGVTPVVPAPAPGPAVTPGGSKRVSDPTRRLEYQEMFTKRADSHGPAVKPPDKTPSKAPAKPADKPKADEPDERVQTTLEPEEPGDEAPDETTPKGTKPEETAATDKGEVKPGEKGRQNPWRVVDHYKSKNSVLEAKVAELEKKLGNPEEMSNLSKQLETAREETRRLQKELAYHDFTTDPEWKTKIEQPYLDAWAAGLKVMNELTITEADGTTRQATQSDLTRLANMNLGDARRQANEWFGDSADDVMAARREILRTHEARESAHKDAQEKALQDRQTRQQQAQQIHRENMEIFERINQQQIKDQEFLHAREGDDEYNGRLDKAKAFVEKTLSHKPSDPKLTREQREQLLRDVVTVRNRAIGFGPLRLELKRARAEVKALKKQLEEIHGGEPGAGSGRKAREGEVVVDVRERAHQAFRKAADVSAPRMY